MAKKNMNLGECSVDSFNFSYNFFVENLIHCVATCQIR